jgi:hypothetical protein
VAGGFCWYAYGGTGGAGGSGRGGAGWLSANGS